MGRKSTARATPIVDKKVYTYKIGIKGPDRTHVEEIDATSIVACGDYITAYLDDEKIGEFCDWAFWYRLDDPKEVLILKEGTLPKTLGQV